MMKTMKALLGVLLLILCGLTFAPNTALAHGEKALEPFIRMRTIQWYDVTWSKDKLNVHLIAHSHDDVGWLKTCLLYTSPSPRDRTRSRMPSSA